MFTKIRKIDSPQYFKQLVSLTDGQIQFKNSCDDVLKRNLSTREKFVAVVGPCSADDVESVTLYCKKLKEIADKVKDKIIVDEQIDSYLGNAKTELDDEATK